VTGTPSNTATVTIGTSAPVAGIPTLDPRMLLVLAALLGLAGARFARGQS
jgi:nitrate/nitrite transporter NarK